MYSSLGAVLFVYHGEPLYSYRHRRRWDHRDGYQIDLWLRTKAHHLHQAQEILHGLALPTFPESSPAPLCLPLILHCGTALCCAVLMPKQILGLKRPLLLSSRLTSWDKVRWFSLRKGCLCDAGLEPLSTACIRIHHWSSAWHNQLPICPFHHHLNT